MTSRGFTLIEVLIYITLFGMLVGGAVASAYSLMESGVHTDQMLGVDEEGTFINRKLNWALTGATDVSTTGSSLAVVRPDLGGTLTFALADGAMTLARPEAPPLPLTASAYAVSNVQFSVGSDAGSQKSVSVSYSVDGTPFVFKRYLR
ncbi:MAG TPA: prepilin-type N-terminal cleavage/methylation domain-containing protein [Candidatus Paceibacterota bacterium]|nr:prepilin-type N-terminal cleavage/methylation domain-containing protein [Candidatus Paceibacterota bacterium]